MRRRAVIFDDNDLIRHTLWSFFDRRGYEVFTYPDPSLCPLHVVPKCPCLGDASCADLIISDVDMFGTNGINWIESLIGKGCKQRNFALMSGNFTPSDLARAAKIGCALFSKPLNMDAMTAWLEAVEASISSGRILYNWVAAD